MDLTDRLTGPVDFAVFEFPGNKFNGAIAPNIVDLVDRGLVTILDLVFVKKDQGGRVTKIEIKDMDASEIGAISTFSGNTDDLASDEDIAEVASILEPNSSALLVVWENSWLAPLSTALYQSGGQLVSSGRIPSQDLIAAIEASN